MSVVVRLLPGMRLLLLLDKMQKQQWQVIKKMERHFRKKGCHFSRMYLVCGAKNPTDNISILIPEFLVSRVFFSCINVVSSLLVYAIVLCQ